MGWLADLTAAAEHVARETLEDIDTIIDRWLDSE